MKKYVLWLKNEVKLEKSYIKQERKIQETGVEIRGKYRSKSFSNQWLPIYMPAAMVGPQRTFSILDALKQLLEHFESPLENPLKPTIWKIIKTLFKTSPTSKCLWCFISFTNLTFRLTRQKSLTSGRYFDPWESSWSWYTKIKQFVNLVTVLWNKVEDRYLYCKSWL